MTSPLDAYRERAMFAWKDLKNAVEGHRAVRIKGPSPNRRNRPCFLERLAWHFSFLESVLGLLQFGYRC
ncbi:hypothetical protein Aduo_010633 [Ancylostoma duodenale]